MNRWILLDRTAGPSLALSLLTKGYSVSHVTKCFIHFTDVQMLLPINCQKIDLDYKRKNSLWWS